MSASDDQAVQKAALGKLALMQAAAEPPPRHWADEGLPFNDALQIYEASVLEGLQRDFHRIRMLLHHTRFSEAAQAWLLKALIQLSEEVQDQ